MGFEIITRRVFPMLRLILLGFFATASYMFIMWWVLIWYLTPFNKSIPLLLRAVYWTALYVALLWYLPAALLRSAGSVDPFGIDAVVVSVSNTVLGTLPVFAVWLWFPDMSTSLVNQLREVSRADKLDDLNVRRNWHMPASIAIVAIPVGPLYFGLSGDAIVEWWEAVGWWGWAYIWLITGFRAVLLAVTALRVLSFFAWLEKQLAPGIIVRPLDPDGCGGLGFLGSLLMRLALFAIVFGLWLAANLWNIYNYNHQGRPLDDIAIGLAVTAVVLLMIYMVFGWAIAVRPTLLAHRAMVKERDSLLTEISARFETAVNHPEQSPPTRVARMQRLVTEHSLIRASYPVWPFSLIQLRGLSVISILPPAIGIAAAVIQIFNRPSPP